MLWTDDASFVQVLEGDREAIEGTMDRIRNDPRHTAVTVACDREVTTRAFGNWGMCRGDVEPDFIDRTAYLVGYIRREAPAYAGQLIEIISAIDG